MYGFWILVIIFAIIGITCLVLSSTAKSYYKKYKEQLTYEYEIKGYYGDPVKRERMFDCDDRDKELLSEAEYLRLKKIYQKYRFWYNMYYDVEEGLFITGGVCVALAVIFVFISILVPINAAEEAAYWQEFKPMAEDIINNSTSAQALGITDEVIEYNTWLAKVRSSQEIWKNWSSYYNIDLSTLDYISIGGN